MRIPFILVFFLISLAVNQTSFAGNSDRTALTDSIFKLGYLDERFSNSGILIKDLIEQLTSDAENRPIAGLLISLFEDAPLETWAKESIYRNLRTQDAETVLNYDKEYNFKAFMNILYAGNINFDDEETQDALQRYLIRLEDDPQAEDRFEVISAIIQKTRMLQIQVQMIEDVITTVVFGMNIALPEDERLTDREVNDLIITFRLNFRELFNNVLPITLLFTTKDIPLETLLTHSTFLDSASGRWFIRTINTAALDSFGEFTQLASAEIAEWMLVQADKEE